MRLALTGATGVVGRFLLEHLAVAHPAWSVRVLLRDAAAGALLPGRPDVVVGDLSNNVAMARLVADCDALVHAAFSHIPGRYRGGEGDDPLGFWRTNHLGTVALLQAAAAAGVRRGVLLSSRAVFTGDPTPRRVGDASPLAPDGHYGALKAASEQLLGVWPEMVLTALRPTGIYGVRTPPSASKWHALVHAQAPLPQASRSEVHGLDVAAAIALLLGAPADQVARQAFNCADLLVGPADLAEGIAAVTGRRPGPVPVAPPAPGVQMECPGLLALGWRPGGWPRWHETLLEMAAGPGG